LIFFDFKIFRHL